MQLQHLIQEHIVNIWHRLYLGLGKAYDYGSSHSFLIGSNGNVFGNLQPENSYSTPFFFVGIGYRIEG